MNERQFKLDELVLHALESGVGQSRVIVALHGWLDNAATFNEMRQHFDDYHFIALDLMGHGYTDHRPASMPYYIWDNVSDVLAIIDQLGLEKVTLLGHSMGASIATLFAGAFPERVEKLFLIEGLAPLVYEAAELPVLMADAITKRSKMKAKKLRPYPNKESAIDVRMSGRWPVNRQAAEWLIDRGLKQTPEGYIWRSDRGLMLPSLLRMSESQVGAFLQAITVPVRLYLGDTGIYDDLWGERVKLISDVEIVRLQGNHHLHLESAAARSIAEDIKNSH
ncbi:alpha/beta hydrolase [Neptunomonas antarctica]|uniref:Epoxide hydrolase. Serine peptidase. MEROPS family S33 n=1 Tax=Neptunomonas antarctica TaxID=619304 RepID=A0A1N7K9Z7_9GAMM|nr:alpha/beta fold hydrolase [Neptunomonas antarctica]SIS58294.1 epoxide hydrolase. Serine peptidase. MEROPS family S33 [Neptunomonas antarctica]